MARLERNRDTARGKKSHFCNGALLGASDDAPDRRLPELLQLRSESVTRAVTLALEIAGWDLA